MAPTSLAKPEPLVVAAHTDGDELESVQGPVRAAQAGDVEPVAGVNAKRSEPSATILSFRMPERNEEILTPVLTPVGAAEPGEQPPRGRGWGAASALSLIMHASMAAALFLVVQAPPELKIAKGDEPMQVSFIQLPKPVPEPPAPTPAPPAPPPPQPEPPPPEPPKPVEPPKPAEPPKPVVEKPKPKPKPKPVEHSQQKPLPKKVEPAPEPVAQAAPAPAPAPAATAAPSQPAPAAAPSGPPKTAGLPTGSIDDADIRPIKMTPPEYPEMLRRRGVGGEVRVMFTVTADGRLADIQVLEASNKQLERAVLEVLGEWRFAPRVSGGQIVPRKATKTFNFKIQRR